MSVGYCTVPTTLRVGHVLGVRPPYTGSPATGEEALFSVDENIREHAHGSVSNSGKVAANMRQKLQVLLRHDSTVPNALVEQSCQVPHQRFRSR